MKPPSILSAACLASTLLVPPALAQDRAAPAAAPEQQIPDKDGAEPSNVSEQLEDPQAANVRIVGHGLEPKQVEPTPER